MQISKKAIQLIINAEISSIALYNQKYTFPTWPTGESGVTFGIGYDAGYETKAQIRKDWEGHVNGNILSYMLSVCGLKGSAAKSKITAITKGFKIPYDVAYKIFVEHNLPRYAKQALEAYPGLDKLNADTIGAIISLVYNRGTAFGTKDKPSWNTRKEMRELAPLILAGNYEAIANKILEMKRLWDGLDDTTGKRTESETRLMGLIERRNNEADLILRGNRIYNDSELFSL